MVNVRDFAPWDDPATLPLISCEQVTKRFGGIAAVDDLSLTIFPREFFALLGPSGCGKTTLMRMLAGFEVPDAGRITLDGEDLAGVPPNLRPVNMMFQSYALFPHLTVWDNIAFGLRRQGKEQGQMDARVEEMLRLTRLAALARRRPDQISGGQRQRVALARALARAPKLLLLDEPLGALDKKLRQETQFELMDIQESTGTTFIIVTHDQEEAMTVASRVAVMNEGRIAQIDPPEGIYERPASALVAAFIGEVTLITGVVRTRGGLSIHWAEGQEPIAAETGLTLQDGQQVQVALRPEKIAVSSTRPTAADNAFSGKIIDIAYLGNVSTWRIELDGGVSVRAQTANTRRIDRQSFTWDDKVWVSWPAGAGVVLDR